MDSYEFYLLYHGDRNKFFEMFIEENQEALIALNKLLKNGRINKDDNIFFQKLLLLIESDVCSNFLLDEVLQQLITSELFEASKHYLIENESNLSKLRISKVLVDFALQNLYTGVEIEQFCESLVDCIFKDSNIRHYAIGILYGILKKDEKLKKIILSAIFDRSMERHDFISAQNLCSFFKQLCQDGLKIEKLTFIEKYFDDDSELARKQGIFLLKCLLEHNLLSEDNEGNWKRFITIIETLEENQSHLILPSLDLLHEMTINESFEIFWFKLCTMVINHENSLVKSYGLNYIFGMRERKFLKPHVLKILEALNATYLFDPKDEKFLKATEGFVEHNSDSIFELLVEINWFSVPFYHVLKSLQNLKIPDNANHIKDFLFCFEKQTEIIPKRIRNIKVRALIKVLYSNLLAKIMASEEVRKVLRILSNIFHINSNHDCLDECISHIKREDYALIFCGEYEHEFLKYLLLKTHAGKTIDEIKDCVKHMNNNQKLIMEVMLEMNELMENYEDVPNILVHETIETVWMLLTAHEYDSLKNALDRLEMGLKASKDQIENEILDHITEIWTRINSLFVQNEIVEYSYLKSTYIILKYNPKFDTKFVEKECFSSLHLSQNKALLTSCQALITRNQFFNKTNQRLEYIEAIMNNIETLLDISSLKHDIFDVYEILEIITLHMSKEVPDSFLEKLKNIFKNFIHTSSSIIDLSVKFWKSFIELSWKSIENLEFLASWMTSVEEIYKTVMNDLNDNDRFSLLLAMYDFMKEFSLGLATNNVLNYFKTCLVDAMFEVHVMSRDEQIENGLVHNDDEETRQKIQFRLNVAKLLLNLYGDEFSTIVGTKILELSVVSRKKARYYPNSKIHRLKLHHFQPLHFCKFIDKDIIEVLVYELLIVNNQLNVIYMLEIILASQYPDILQLLNADKELNAQALKSIFAIAIIQMKTENDFEKAERRLDTIFNSIFPYSMGQNFGVRIYSLLTMILSYEHIKTLPNFTETTITLKIFEICNAILESVKQKNCLKYFNALRDDFRFTKDYKELNTYQVFYQHIPKVTRMPFEEIIIDEDRGLEKIFAADMLKEGDSIVMADEFEIKSDKQTCNGIVNLQQKYLPFKNQSPGENLLRTLPERFKVYDENEACLKPESELIVVASLIDNNTNLGGLARTCEIFGISKYVIHSLKSQENFEFKSLSRTSEKWIQISEIKKWQLIDYLIAMKRSGYIIAGAEQSGNSVSLLNAKMPKKCVLLLGNEKRGIPADLLGLLDLVIEIPQSGVVRSLNVHVAGAILIWEYAKQHSL